MLSVSILMWRSAALEFQGPHQYGVLWDALSDYPDVQPGCVDHISMATMDALSEYPVVLPGCVGT